MTDQDALMVTVLPTTSRYAAEDPRRRQEANELADELRRFVAVAPTVPDPNSKGAVETAAAITVMLSSLRAVRYAVAALQIWIERDSKREAEIRIDGQPPVHVRLKGFDPDALIRVVEVARARVGRMPD
jgi:hypothetical protein